MNISIDQVRAGCVDDLIKWDLTIKRNGVGYAINEVTVAAMFSTSMPLSSYFAQPPEDLDKWSGDEVQVLLQTVEAYALWRSKKNRDRVRGEIDMAMAAQR